MINRVTAIFMFCISFLLALGVLFYYVFLSPFIISFKRIRAYLNRKSLKKRIEKLNQERNKRNVESV